MTTKAKTTQVIAAKESKVKAVKVPKSYLAMLEFVDSFRSIIKIRLTPSTLCRPSPSTSPSEDAEVLSALVSEAEAGEAPSRYVFLSCV